LDNLYVVHACMSVRLVSATKVVQTERNTK
jgi:hypothetical protein